MTAGIELITRRIGPLLKIWEIFSGNNIIADFYSSGVNATRGYSENANVVVLNQSDYLEIV